MTQHLVTDADTALAAGSGDLGVLGTPRLLAWLEGTTCAAIASGLKQGETSVGTHVRASLVDAAVSVSAELVHVDGRLLRFQVQACDTDGVVLAHGEITRVVVDAERFLGRLRAGQELD
jgi:predicted thioesterase